MAIALELIQASQVSVQEVVWHSQDKQASVRLHFMFITDEGRPAHQWQVIWGPAASRNNFIMTDIFGGVGEKPDALKALCTFTHLMYAWQEAVQYNDRKRQQLYRDLTTDEQSENSDLFPAVLETFRMMYCDEMVASVTTIEEDQD